MEFQFASLAEFWAMKGHGPYVWACYALALSTLVYLIDAPRRKHHQYLKQQHALKVAQAHINKSSEK